MSPHFNIDLLKHLPDTHRPLTNLEREAMRNLRRARKILVLDVFSRIGVAGARLRPSLRLNSFIRARRLKVDLTA